LIDSPKASGSVAHSRGLVAALFSAALAMSACGGGGGGGGSAPPPPPSNGDQPYADPTFYSTAPTGALANAIEGGALTHHQITLRGSTIDYTAIAAHLNARNATTGADQASIFYVAYTVDNQDVTTRPITFFYNGGPGSATAWLHLGSFGPKRLVTGDPSTSAPKPFPLVDNQETLLDTYKHALGMV